MNYCFAYEYRETRYEGLFWAVCRTICRTFCRTLSGKTLKVLTVHPQRWHPHLVRIHFGCTRLPPPDRDSPRSQMFCADQASLPQSNSCIEDDEVHFGPHTWLSIPASFLFSATRKKRRVAQAVVSRGPKSPKTNHFVCGVGNRLALRAVIQVC